MFFENIFQFIKNKWSFKWIIGVFIIAIIGVIGDMIKDFIKEKKIVRSKCIMVIILVIVGAIGIVLEQYIEDGSSWGNTPQISKRYELSDNEIVLEKIKAINKDLENEGKSIDENTLKSFIYAMNRDYSFGDANKSITDVLQVLGNVNNDIVNRVREFYINRSDVTIMNSLADIFTDEKDYEMVLFWQNYYNELAKKIYEKGATKENIDQIGEFGVVLRRTFMDGERLKIADNKYSSKYNVSDEAKFFIFNCICSKIDLLLVSPDGGNKLGSIKYGTASDGNEVYYDVLYLSCEIEQLKSQSYENTINKIKK